MNARLSRIVSRLSLVSVVALSAAGAAACSKASTDDGRTQAAAQEAKASAAKSPGHRMFREIEKLDLRDTQRDALAEVEQNLAADLAPHRETIRQVAETLASAVEDGKLDPEEAAAQRAALMAAAAEANGSIALAMNEVHDALETSQREAIVAHLRAQHERHGRGEQTEAERQDKMARFAIELSLTADQKQAIHEGIRDGMEKAFPERKARREAWEAKSKALGDAFIRDDFNAEDHAIGAGAEEAIASFTEVAEHAIEVSGKVLAASQREALAAMIRERAQKL